MLPNSAADQSNDNPIGDLSILPLEMILAVLAHLPPADILTNRLVCTAFKEMIDQHVIQLSIPKTILRIVHAESFQHALHLTNEIRKNPFYLTLEKKIKEAPEELEMNEMFLYALATDNINTISFPIISTLLDKNLINQTLTDDSFISIITTRNTLLLQSVPPETRTPDNTKNWAQNLWMNPRIPLLLSNVSHNVPFTNLSHAQLSNLDFNYKTTKNGEKIGINMDHTNFEHANFNQSKLENTFFTDCYFAYANLSDCLLAHAELTRVNFSHAIIKGASFEHAKLNDIDFTNADLTGVSFKNATLNHINLSHANLTNLDLENANIKHARFLDHITSADLTEKLNAVMTLLHKNKFTNNQLAPIRMSLAQEIIAAANNMSPQEGEALLNAALHLKSIFGQRDDVSPAMRGLINIVSSKETPLTKCEDALQAAREELLAQKSAAPSVKKP